MVDMGQCDSTIRGSTGTLADMLKGMYGQTVPWQYAIRRAAFMLGYDYYTDVPLSSRESLLKLADRVERGMYGLDNTWEEFPDYFLGETK